jgi:hypothetical protein
MGCIYENVESGNSYLSHLDDDMYRDARAGIEMDVLDRFTMDASSSIREVVILIDSVCSQRHLNTSQSSI